jgi:hypothetical protein
MKKKIKLNLHQLSRGGIQLQFFFIKKKETLKLCHLIFEKIKNPWNSLKATDISSFQSYCYTYVQKLFLNSGRVKAVLKKTTERTMQTRKDHLSGKFSNFTSANTRLDSLCIHYIITDWIQKKKKVHNTQQPETKIQSMEKLINNQTRTQIFLLK